MQRRDTLATPLSPQSTWTPITHDRTLNAKESEVTTEDADKTMTRLYTNRAENTRPRLMANSTARRLTTQLETQERRRDLDRLQELRDPHVSHDRAQLVDPARGQYLHRRTTPSVYATGWGAMF